MDYQFENLGPDRFQQLVQALFVRSYPEVACFPIGQPDGGRDATVRGKDSLAVVQVKFTSKAESVSDPVTWLLAAVRGERSRIAKLVARGATRYLLVTNISGSGALDVGQRDRLQSELQTDVPIPVEVWWREEVGRRLDDAWDCKWSFAEVMSTPDLLRLVLELSGEDFARRRNAIHAYLIDQHARDEEVRFKQVELQNRLLDLYVDVPVNVAQDHGSERGRSRVQGVLHRIAGGDGDDEFLEIEVDADTGESFAVRTGRTVGAASMLLDQLVADAVPFIVLEGAPGQGKSTVTQYLCQVHRIRLLEKNDELAELPAEHRATPLRFPMRVDLRDYAAWILKRNPFGTADDDVPADWKPSLEAFLAAQVSYASGGVNFSVADLLAIASATSLLIVLDGLDEVPDVKHRAAIVAEIEGAGRRLSGATASLQLIVTSRPTAFANSPGPSERTFSYCQLDPLPKGVVDDYVQRWLKVRRITGRDAAQFADAIRQKLELPHLRELARNPMQLAILISLVRARGESLPEKRTALYDLYVDLFFDREAEKSTVVRRNRELLKAIHQYLAWYLQAEAQTGTGSGAIGADALKDLVKKFLAEREYDQNLADEIFQGVTERVVALVSRVEGRFEFEVQPLREYFAARFLYETAPMAPAAESQKGSRPERLDALLRDPYWLNVARFFAGCHTVGELAGVAVRLEELIEENPVGRLAHARTVGAMLLGDWVLAQDPRSKRRVISSVLTRPSWRLMFAGERIPRSNSSLVLPASEGGTSLVEQCLLALRDVLPADFETELIQLILRNGGATSISAAWRGDDAPLERGDWWRIGARIGALGTQSDTAMEQLLIEHGEDQDKLLALMTAGRTEIADRSPRRLRLTVDAILDGRGTPIDSRKSSLIGALGAVLQIRRLGAFRAFSPSRMVEDLSTITKREQPDGAVADEVRLALREFVEGAGHGSETTDGYRRFLATATSLWGDRPALWRLGIAVSRGSESSLGQDVDLDDSAMDLVELINYARAQPGSARWWSEQLSRTSTRTVLKLALAMTFAGPRTLAAIAALLDARIAGLTIEEWNQLMSLWRMTPSVRNRHSAPIDLEAPTARFATTLWPRIDRVAREKYRSSLYDYEGQELRVRALASTEALSEAQMGRISWTKALDITEASYRAGAVGQIDAALRQEADRTNGKNQPPPRLVDRVLAAPESFPGSLVAWLEQRERQRVFAALPTVPDVAQRNGWFVTDGASGFLSP